MGNYNVFDCMYNYDSWNTITCNKCMEKQHTITWNAMTCLLESSEEKNTRKSYLLYHRNHCVLVSVISNSNTIRNTT